MKNNYGIIHTDATSDKVGLFPVYNDAQPQEVKPVEKEKPTQKVGLFPIDQHVIIKDTHLKGESELWKKQ